MIKKGLLIIGVLSILFSCKEEAPKNYAKLSGKIKNAKAGAVTIKGRTGYSKTITIDDNGAFSDTLHLTDKGELFLFSVKTTTRVFLKNGYDLDISFDASQLEKTIKFEGKGAVVNNYYIAKTKQQRGIDIDQVFELKKEDFEGKIDAISKDFLKLLSNYSTMEEEYYTKEKEDLENLPNLLKQQYEKLHKASLNGKKSPEFKDYENYKGGTTSLSDLKGKYVYIDVWATWCGPCKGEIPHLKKLEDEFKGQNIQFVSISVDRPNAKDTWKKMIKDKNMGGIQLFARAGDNFAKDYKISSIPRFILIDPNGMIVKDNMSRPSNPKTKEFLQNLLK